MIQEKIFGDQDQNRILSFYLKNLKMAISQKKVMKKQKLITIK